MEVDVENAKKITLACCILHNLLKIEKIVQRTDELINPLNQNTQENNSTNTSASYSYEIRATFADWCINEGDLEFQYNMI